jgi:hypothetical protein
MMAFFLDLLPSSFGCFGFSQLWLEKKNLYLCFYPLSAQPGVANKSYPQMINHFNTSWDPSSGLKPAAHPTNTFFIYYAAITGDTPSRTPAGVLIRSCRE